MTDAEKKAEDDRIWDVLTEPIKPAACKAPTALLNDPKASRWERDKAEAVAIGSKECQMAIGS